MTRQKKELVKKIRFAYDMIAADEELGCGFAPAGFYDKAYHEIYKMEEELAHLRHYKSVEEMQYDTRWMKGEQDIPFTA